MATRLDRMSRASFLRYRDHHRGRVRERPAPEQRTVVPPERLTRAAAAWLALTFVVTGLVLPALVGLAGLGAVHATVQLPAFLLVSAGVVTTIGVVRPRVELGRPAADPWMTATFASFALWALLAPTLLPLTGAVHGVMPDVPTVLVHALQSVMLGTMLASLTRSPRRAFDLAAIFQLATYLVSVALALAAGLV